VLSHWSRYVEGEFSIADCRRCQQHLRQCARCRTLLAELRETLKACRGAKRTQLPPVLKKRARMRIKTWLTKR
jgi:anti-sigma factor RsiW